MERSLLREENIVAGLDAANRKDAFAQIVEALPDWSLQGIEKKKILELLLLREQVGTTAIGQGIALPHCFSSDVHEPIVAFGVSPRGIDYPSLDGRPVHFIFILILPQNEGAERQKRQILQSIKWVLCDRHMQDRLKEARTAAEIYCRIIPESQRTPALEV